MEAANRNCPWHLFLNRGFFWRQRGGRKVLDLRLNYDFGHSQRSSATREVSCGSYFTGTTRPG